MQTLVITTSLHLLRLKRLASKNVSWPTLCLPRQKDFFNLSSNREGTVLSHGDSELGQHLNTVLVHGNLPAPE